MSDIVSSIKDAPLPPKRSPQEALASGRVPYEKPTPENSVMLFIDHQVGLMVGVRDFPSLASYKAKAQAAMDRMSRHGAELTSVFALGCELQADWKLPSGDAMFGPFTNELPEYGFVSKNYWNNANQHVVPDPFGTVV